MRSLKLKWDVNKYMEILMRRHISHTRHTFRECLTGNAWSRKHRKKETCSPQVPPPQWNHQVSTPPSLAPARRVSTIAAVRRHTATVHHLAATRQQRQLLITETTATSQAPALLITAPQTATMRPRKVTAACGAARASCVAQSPAFAILAARQYAPRQPALAESCCAQLQSSSRPARRSACRFNAGISVLQ